LGFEKTALALLISDRKLGYGGCFENSNELLADKLHFVLTYISATFSTIF
jgi:hypothetical protein